jgi:ribosomal protein S18 acetylase RimI-like enzyme
VATRKPGPEFSLRPARAEDASSVAACVDAAYRHYVARIGMLPGPMTEDYEEVIRDFQVTVAENGDNIVAVLVLAHADEGFLLENVAVVPEHRGRGLGKRLMELAELEARRQAFDSIYLYTHERMTENQEIYRHLGYIEYARRAESGFHRVYMRKKLD